MGHNLKNLLHSWCKLNRFGLPQYIVQELPKDQSSAKINFEAIVSVQIFEKNFSARGLGRSIKRAKTAAADSLCTNLNRAGYDVISLHHMSSSFERQLSLQLLRNLRILLDRHFRHKVDKMFSCRSILLIAAGVPILKLNHFKLGTLDIGVDISVNNKAGLRNSHLLHYYNMIDDRFGALVLVVKCWAIKAQIACPASGTLSGLCLTLMVLHFLQRPILGHVPILPDLQEILSESFNANIPVESLRVSNSDILPPNLLASESVEHILKCLKRPLPYWTTFLASTELSLLTEGILQANGYRPVSIKKSSTVASEASVRDIWREADAVCFDVDSTVCVNEAIDDLAEFCGVGAQVADVTRRAMNGCELSFRDALTARLDLIKPSRGVIRRFLAQHPPRLTPGVERLVSALHARHVPVYLVTGGFRCIVQPVAEILSIPMAHVYANVLLFDDQKDGAYTGLDATQPTSSSGGKALVVAELKRRHSYHRLVTIGDGVTDLETSPPADAFIGIRV